MLKLTSGVILRQKSIFSIIFYLFLWKSFKHINSYNGHYYLSKIFLCTSSTCLKSTVIYRSFIEFNSTWNTMVNNTQISCNYLILFHSISQNFLEGFKCVLFGHYFWGVWYEHCAQWHLQLCLNTRPHYWSLVPSRLPHAHQVWENWKWHHLLLKLVEFYLHQQLPATAHW